MENKARTAVTEYRKNWEYVDEDCGAVCAPQAFAALEQVLTLADDWKHRADVLAEEAMDIRWKQKEDILRMVAVEVKATISHCLENSEEQA